MACIPIQVCPPLAYVACIQVGGWLGRQNSVMWNANNHHLGTSTLELPSPPATSPRSALSGRPLPLQCTECPPPPLAVH